MNAYLSENENHEIPQVFYRVQTIYRPKLIISSRFSGGCISTDRELMIFIKALFGRKLFNKNIFNCLLTVISFRFPCIMCYRCNYKLWESTPGMGLSDADTYENIHKFLLRNKGLSFVCRYEDKLIGTILCGHDGRRGYIYHVTVVEKYRGRGIGQMLVDKSLQKLKEEGVDKCHLFVFADNEIGKAFWSGKGWMKRLFAIYRRFHGKVHIKHVYNEYDSNSIDCINFE